MRFGPCLLFAMVSLGFSTSAAAEEARIGVPPPTGVEFIASGIALSVFGTFSFIAVPICQSAIVIPQEQSACSSTSLAVGVPFAIGGASLIVIGAFQHAHYKTWMLEHPALRGLGFTPTSHGGAFGWSASF